MEPPPHVGCLVVALALAGCDLFHSTEWPTRCDEQPGLGSCHDPGEGGAGVGGAGGAGEGGQAADGTAPDRAGVSCRQLYLDEHSTSDHAYWIDPDGPGATEPFEAWCDMERGGWTLAGVISADDEQGWMDPARWVDASAAGPTAELGFDLDMKNAAWSTLPVTQLRLENASGGSKTTGSLRYASLAALFSETTRVSLDGVESGWTYPATDDTKFFAEVQNPPVTAGVNLAPRNRCILTMGFDDYSGAAGPDHQVHGFGCSEGTGEGSGACYETSCADVVRDASLLVWIR